MAPFSVSQHGKALRRKAGILSRCPRGMRVWVRASSGLPIKQGPHVSQQEPKSHLDGNNVLYPLGSWVLEANEQASRPSSAAKARVIGAAYCN